jgi:hypothetical protein
VVNPRRVPVAGRHARAQDKPAQAVGRHELVAHRAVVVENLRAEQAVALFRLERNTVPADEVDN